MTMTSIVLPELTYLSLDGVNMFDKRRSENDGCNFVDDFSFNPCLQNQESIKGTIGSWKRYGTSQPSPSNLIWFMRTRLMATKAMSPPILMLETLSKTTWFQSQGKSVFVPLRLVVYICIDESCRIYVPFQSVERDQFRWMPNQPQPRLLRPLESQR